MTGPHSEKARAARARDGVALARLEEPIERGSLWRGIASGEAPVGHEKMLDFAD